MASVGTIGIDIAVQGVVAATIASVGSVSVALALAGRAGSTGNVGLAITPLGAGAKTTAVYGTITMNIAVAAGNSTIYPWAPNQGVIIFPNVAGTVIGYSPIFYQGCDMLLAMSPAPVPTSQITMTYVNTDGQTVSYTDRRMYYTTLGNQSYLVDRIQPGVVGLGTWTVTASYVSPNGLIKTSGKFVVVP